jgi:hypothetical protein
LVGCSDVWFVGPAMAAHIECDQMEARGPKIVSASTKEIARIHVQGGLAGLPDYRRFEH